MLEEDAPKPYAQGRLIQREQAPFEVMKSWLARCLKDHGPECKNLAPESWITPWDIPGVRLLDVEEACLVKMPKNCQYITLSYVWGTTPSFMTTKANIKELESPGILQTLAQQLPRTIRDTIDLVKMMGYRFLWVDRLCIVQDDEANVQANVWNMDQIYGQSMLVIIAADGDDADSGLSRTRPPTEAQQQTILRIGPTLQLVTVTDSRTVRATSTHRHRGWTYQEEFFARRKLIFAGDRVFFVCDMARWQEDISSEGRMMQSKRAWPSKPLLGDSINLPYRTSVQDYTSRQLTFPSDVMNAFAGVSNYWAELFGATMKYGLPNSVFDWAVLWRALQPLRQRQGQGCTFPTWSWAGWVGPVLMHRASEGHEAMQHWLTNHTWIIWYQWSPSLTALLWDVNHERKGKAGLIEARVGYRASNTIDPHGRHHIRFRIDGGSQDRVPDSFVEVEGLNDPHLRSSLHTKSGQVLVFWTMSAKFGLKKDEKLSDNNWTILDRRGLIAGHIVPDRGAEAMQAEILDGERPFELIALSDSFQEYFHTLRDMALDSALKRLGTRKYPKAQWKGMSVIDTGPKTEDAWLYKSYNVMLIHWQGPLAVRRGIGTIFKQAMNYALDPGPVWKPIILG
ncbi:MAG: hypothetical protein LQ346_008191 [Caloplaca aetnensis]|nr:MAG: hypothetical protein LQ346_008191 [Caloplaca aetnensis]